MIITKDWLIEKGAPSDLVTEWFKPMTPAVFYIYIARRVDWACWLLRLLITEKQLSKWKLKFAKDNPLFLYDYIHQEFPIGQLVDPERVTIEDLGALRACAPGLRWFRETYPNGAAVREIVKTLTTTFIRQHPCGPFGYRLGLIRIID